LNIAVSTKPTYPEQGVWYVRLFVTETNTYVRGLVEEHTVDNLRVEPLTEGFVNYTI